MANDLLNKHVAKATYVFNALDSSGVANSTVASHGMGLVIPAGAVVTNAYFNVTTAFTTASTTTVALTLASAGDLVVGITVAGSPWSTTGLRGTLVNSPIEATVAGDTGILSAARSAGTWLLLTAHKELTVTIGTAAPTAGAMDIYIEYVL